MKLKLTLIAAIAACVAVAQQLPDGMWNAGQADPTNWSQRADMNMVDAMRFTAAADNIILNRKNAHLSPEEAKEAAYLLTAADRHRRVAIDQLQRPNQTP